MKPTDSSKEKKKKKNNSLTNFLVEDLVKRQLVSLLQILLHHAANTESREETHINIYTYIYIHRHVYIYIPGVFLHREHLGVRLRRFPEHL